MDMGQYWDLFNMDKREQIEIRAGKTMNEFFFRPDPARQLETLLTRLAESNSIIKYIETYVLPREEVKVDRGLEASKSTTFDQLPTEILDMIFDYNNDLTNNVLLSLTCRRFWEIGKRRITRIRDNLIAKNTWAGTRVICAGDFQEENDWPPGIPKEDHDSYLLRYDWPDRSRNTQCLQPRFDRRFFTLNLSETIILNYICGEYCMSNCLVLRNLSKRLYVRDEGLEQLCEGFECKPNPPLTFGHIVLAKICWSTSDFVSMRYKGPIHRGEWAGDKLEIVPTFQHAREVEEAEQSTLNHEGLALTYGNEEGGICEWKDVTEECMRLIEDIWMAN